MMRMLIPALFVALVLSVPAAPEGEGDMEAIREVVRDLSEKIEKHERAIRDLEARASLRRTEARLLLKALEKAEKDGFYYPAPHVGAKKALVEGLKRYASKVAGGDGKK